MEDNLNAEDVIEELLGRIAMLERDRAVLVARVKSLSRQIAESKLRTSEPVEADEE